MAETIDELPAGIRETDAIPVRKLQSDDLETIVEIDRRATGLVRREFYRSKLARAMEDSSLQLSLAAELDDRVVGFVIVSFYYGEFGVPEQVAVIEAIGVHPDYRGRLVGTALLNQLEMNLRALGVERIRTEVDWEQRDLLLFLAHQEFEPARRFCLEREL